jgi:hypothetical protein
MARKDSDTYLQTLYEKGNLQKWKRRMAYYEKGEGASR